MYTIWYFATGDLTPRHIGTGNDFENLYEAVESEFGFDWYGREYETLASGGQVLCDRNDVHGAGVLVCVRDPRP